jgi:hypothetical protein
MSLGLLVVLVLPASAAEPAATAPEPVEYLPQARALYRVAACGGDGPIPEHLNKTVVDLHCAELRPAINSYRRTWITAVKTFMVDLVPEDVPQTLVYPFGGGDLVGALATFRDVREVTTVSLEPSGDPRGIDRILPVSLPKALDLNRRNFLRLFEVAHSKTERMKEASQSWLPAQLIMALGALVVHGYEPTGLRYFHLERDGTIRYVTPQDVRATAGEIKLARLSNWKSEGRWRALFSNMELRFRPVGGGPERVYRHIATDCLDEQLVHNPGLIAHLSSKGRVSMMTKAASYLLWWPTFSKMREYVLGHIAWMVSDSTGVPPHLAETRGYEMIPYGTFRGPFFQSGDAATASFRELWLASEHRPLPFYWGYPDSSGRPHLVVTRPVPGLGQDLPGAGSRAAATAGEGSSGAN